MISMTDVRKAQEVLRNALNEWVKDTTKEVESSQPLDGVKILGKGCVVVKASNLLNSWDPATYIPEEQVAAVNKSLSSVTSVDAFVKKIDEMIEKKMVKQTNKTVVLNIKTINALKSVKEKLEA